MIRGAAGKSLTGGIRFLLSICLNEATKMHFSVSFGRSFHARIVDRNKEFRIRFDRAL